MRRFVLRGLACLIGLGLAAPFCFHLIRDPDAGWHLALGRLISASGIPFRNVLTWTATDEPWYATSWLYDWLAASITTRFDIAGLQVLTLVFVAATLVGFTLAASRVNPVLGAWMAPAAGLIIIPRISERPHMASLVLLTIVMWLCLPAAGEPADFRDRARTQLGWKRRLACVPIIAVFANAHAGAAFPAGMLALFCAEAFLGGGRRWREAAIGLAGLAALFANPGGVFNLHYLLANAHQQAAVPVAELESPTWQTAPDFFVAAPVALVPAWVTRRKSPAWLASTVFFLLLGFKAVRLVWDFELLAAVGVAQALSMPSAARARRLLPWMTLVPLASTGLLAWLRYPMYRNLPIGTRFDEQVLPVRAADFVRSERIAGRPFNAIGDGGYLEWALPDREWFQDTRVQAFPADIFKQEQDLESSPSRFRDWATGRGVDWVITSRQPLKMAGYGKFDSSDWALVYWDETSEVRLRRDVPRFESLIGRLEYLRFRPNAPVTVAKAAVPELIGWDVELRRYEASAPDDPAAAIIHCAVLTRLGGEDAAETCERAGRLANTEALRAMLKQVRTLPRAG